MQLKSPLTAQVEITQNCNHSCNHCYNFWRYTETGSCSYAEDRTKVRKIFQKIIDAEIFHVVITGGEPLIYADEVIEYTRLLNDNNVAMGLNTNLSLMTPDLSRRLSDVGLKSILTSLLSYNPETHHRMTNTNDTYQKIIDNISSLTKNNYHISINMVVSKENLKDVYETGKLAHKLGARTFCATKITPQSYGGKSHLGLCLDREQTKQMLEDLVRLNEDTGISIQTLNPIPLCFIPDIDKYRGLLTKNCSAGKTSVGISASGEVRACQHSSTTYGYILEENLEVIWKRMGDWRDGSYIPKICINCDALRECGGGCRESALAFKGALNKPDMLVTGKFKGSKRQLNPQEILDSHIQLRLSNNIKYRLEEEGAVIYKTPKDFAILDDSGFNLIRALIGQVFSISEIERSLNMPVQGFISRLYSRGVIDKV